MKARSNLDADIWICCPGVPARLLSDCGGNYSPKLRPFWPLGFLGIWSLHPVRVCPALSARGTQELLSFLSSMGKEPLICLFPLDTSCMVGSASVPCPSGQDQALHGRWWWAPKAGGAVLDLLYSVPGATVGQSTALPGLALFQYTNKCSDVQPTSNIKESGLILLLTTMKNRGIIISLITI